MWTRFDRKLICLLFAMRCRVCSAVRWFIRRPDVPWRRRNALAQEDNWGGISDAAIENPLPPFDADHAGEPLKQAVAIDKRLRQICLVFDDAVAKELPQKINPKDVGVANAAIWRMDRLIGKLANQGEPAATDFKSRCFEYRRSIQKAAQACVGLPTFPSVGKQLPLYAAQQQKVLEQVNPLIAEGNYDAADQSVTKLLDLLGQLEPWVPLGLTPEPLFAARDAIDMGRETLFGPPRREKLLRRCQGDPSRSRRIAQRPPCGSQQTGGREGSSVLWRDLSGLTSSADRYRSGENTKKPFGKPSP